MYKPLKNLFFLVFFLFARHITFRAYYVHRFRAISVWPWNENAWTKHKEQTNRKRAIWFIECIQKHMAFGWLSERSDIYIYCINTNEIPRELSRENLISSHVKISPLLWLHNKLHLSDQKTISGRLEIRNFSSRVKKIFHLFAALTRDIFFNTRREISYPRAAM